MDDQQARDDAAKALSHRATWPSLHWPDVNGVQHTDVSRAFANAAIDAYLAALPVAPEQGAWWCSRCDSSCSRHKPTDWDANTSAPEQPTQASEVTDDEVDNALDVNSDPQYEYAAIAMRATLINFLSNRHDRLAALVSSPSVETVTPDREWGVEYGPMRAVNQFSTREECDRFIANPPMWSTPAHRYEPVLVHRRPAGPWERAL